MSDIVGSLTSLLGRDRVLASPAASRAYDCDAYTVDRSRPQCVALPESTEEIAQIVKLCVGRGVPFTPRGAGTGLSGGALAALGGVLISTKRLTKVLEVDIPNRMLRAQAGIPNRKISEAVEHYGLHFAPDPSSQAVSTLGGNIAENSGGPHTLKYGVTAQHVLQVTMVSPTGDIQTHGSLVPGGPGPDPLGLIVGGEGTLGIVTEAWVRLTPVPTQVETGLASFGSIESAAECVAAMIAAGVVPAALEMMDKGVLSALKAAFGLQYPEGTQALLLIECDGPAAEPEMAQAAELCRLHGALDLRLAQNAEERAQLWTARKKGIGAMGRLAPTIVTHDGVIPRSQLPAMLRHVYEVAERSGLAVGNLFHAGDGNLHPCFCFDDREPGIVDRVVHAGEEILDKCIELGGSISGEHGIGVEKLDLMARMFGPEDLRVQMMARHIYNPGDLCNPCKVIPNQKGCVEHSRRWRGAAW